MIQRIKQFYRAVTAHINNEDLKFINTYLNKNEQNLFFSMHVYDQRHVLNVAYTAQNLIRFDRGSVNKRLLIKSCLLHDTGRTAKDISLWDKVFAVLLDKYLSKIAHKIAKYNNNPDRSFFDKRRHALFIYYNHAYISGEKLQNIGLCEIAEIVKYHHSPPRAGDCQELIILRKADSLN